MDSSTDDYMESPVRPADFAQRLWASGQDLLAAGRYVAARRELEAAERQAFRKRDAALLARIYLSLLEVARQIRQFCCDGIIAITPGNTADQRAALREVFSSGGVWLGMQGAGIMKPIAIPIAPDTPVELLSIVKYHEHWRLTSPTCKSGLGRHRGRSSVALQWTHDPGMFILPARPDALVAVLPPPGVYHPGNPRHGQARETLFLTFEALAMGWLGRQGKVSRDWAELAILRQARRIDPACEQIFMRMMTVAQGLIRIETRRGDVDGQKAPKTVVPEMALNLAVTDRTLAAIKNAKRVVLRENIHTT